MAENEPIPGPSAPPGTRITWRAVNGPISGVTAAFRDGNYLVLLDNGKYVIVNEKSLL